MTEVDKKAAQRLRQRAKQKELEYLKSLARLAHEIGLFSRYLSNEGISVEMAEKMARDYFLVRLDRFDQQEEPSDGE